MTFSDLIHPSDMVRVTPATLPLVSVVTPFFNTAPYLAECIESVLAQSYSQFEYVLMDNCSTDGSSEIAATYAHRDPRIRLIRCSQFLSQLQNYNRALAEISDTSKYCKIVQADDWIFPECLQLMVRAFEQSESIGLVSSYWLYGNELCGSGFPRQTPMLPGRECARWFLRTGIGIFGTQTQVMYRSSLVRYHEAFYNVSFPFADLQKCLEILEHWDFGFVHQVLSFSRRDNESTAQALEPFRPYDLLRYIIAQRYAPVFLEVGEAASIITKYKREYYRVLARAVFRLPGRAFWRFHKVGLKALRERETHDWPYLAMMMGPELLWLASNPGMTTIRMLRSLKRKTRPKRGAPQATDRVQPISSLGDRTSAAFSDSSFAEGHGHVGCLVTDYTSGTEGNMKGRERKRKKIAFFGHFDSTNFGNESTLQAILYHLRCFQPNVEVTCICTGPEATVATHHIEAIPLAETFVKSRGPRNPLIRVLRKVCIGLPSEPYPRLAKLLRRVFIGVPREFCRWLYAFKSLKGTDMLIFPGTGLLTDAYGLSSWGPYNLFKWSLIAKLRGCKVFFVSVGAGPIYSTLGRYLIKSALSIADFRSYRDDASMAYLKGIGFPTNSDRVYPDLVFSLPEITMPHDDEKRAGRPVVGLGVMTYAGRYSVEKPSNEIYLEYLHNLVAFAGWLLAHDYVIRLLIGDVSDRSASEEFKSLLKASFETYDEERIIDQPALSVEQLLLQIAATDIVVATRFHTVLLALVLNKPVTAISFHHKCTSLMSDMGLAEYCHDINHMNAGRLIEQFEGVEKKAEKLKPVIRQRVEQSRKALDEQYKLIFKSI